MEHTIQIIYLILRPCLIQFYNKTFHLFWAHLLKNNNNNKKPSSLDSHPCPSCFIEGESSHRLGIINAA